MTASPSDPLGTDPAVTPPLDPPHPPGCPARPTAPATVTALYHPRATSDPMATYQRLRAQHGAVAPVLLEGDVPAWLVLGYNEILHVVRAPSRFTRDARQWRDWQQGRIGTASPLLPLLGWVPDFRSQDGKEHQRLRAAVMGSLDRFDRRGIRRHINRQANLLIDDFSAVGQAELIGQFVERLPMRVITRFLGFPPEAGPALARASRQLVAGTEEAVAAHAYLSDTLRQLMARRHAEPAADLASWLIAHPAELSDDEVESHLRLVLVSAHETTANLMASTLHTLLTDSRRRGSLRGGQMSLPAAIEQVLWDEPPLAVSPARFATCDLELAGQFIRKGDVLLLGLAAGNADPTIRPTPDTPMHGNRSHLSFSSGPHECPGQDIGRAIVDTGIGALLKRLPDVRLLAEEDGLTWTSSTWSRHVNALPVEFTPRPPNGQPSPPEPEPVAQPLPPSAEPPSPRPARWRVRLGLPRRSDQEGKR